MFPGTRIRPLDKPRPCEISSHIRPEEFAVALQLDQLVDELAAPVKHLISTTGKQLRGDLVQRSARAGTGPSASVVRDGAVAIELLHLGTLAHDDVIDDGQRRRGVPTVGMDYGSQAAAFAGLVLIGAAADLIARVGAEPTTRFAEAVTTMCAGEMAEFEELFQCDRSAACYFQTVSKKTASGFAFAAWLGGWLAGSSPEAIDALTRFGQELGMAFQVLDDILDLISQDASAGKLPGKDLQQGVYTLPVIDAMIAEPALKKGLRPNLDEGELLRLVERVRAAGGIDSAVKQCELFIARARDALFEEPVPVNARGPLADLLDVAVNPLDYPVIAASASCA
jgi:heptaprenyl diphosphate synthase